MCSGGRDSEVVEKAMVCARGLLPFPLQRFVSCQFFGGLLQHFILCLYLVCHCALEQYLFSICLFGAEIFVEHCHDY